MRIVDGGGGEPSPLRAPCASCHIVNQEVRELRSRTDSDRLKAGNWDVMTA